MEELLNAIKGVLESELNKRNIKIENCELEEIAWDMANDTSKRITEVVDEIIE